MHLQCGKVKYTSDNTGHSTQCKDGWLRVSEVIAGWSKSNLRAIKGGGGNAMQRNSTQCSSTTIINIWMDKWKNRCMHRDT